jgi:hypothetical protein
MEVAISSLTAIRAEPRDHGADTDTSYPFIGPSHPVPLRGHICRRCDGGHAAHLANPEQARLVVDQAPHNAVADQAGRHVVSSLRMTLPAGLRGIFSTILMSRGCSKRDTLSFKYSRIDASSMPASGWGTTKAASRSP